MISTTHSRKSRVRLASMAEPLGLVAVLVGLIVLFSLFNDRFFTAATLNQIANQVPALTVIAIGATFVIIAGGIDLSVGSVMAFSGAVLGISLVEWGVPLVGAVFLAIFAGVVCGEWLDHGTISGPWFHRHPWDDADCSRSRLPRDPVANGLHRKVRGMGWLAAARCRIFAGICHRGSARDPRADHPSWHSFWPICQGDRGERRSGDILRYPNRANQDRRLPARRRTGGTGGPF